MNDIMAKMGRPKLKHPTKQKRLNLAYMHLLPALKAKLTPPVGVEITDAQTVDICLGTVHGLLVEKGLEVVDPVRMMELVNVQFRKQFVESMTKILGELGHTDIHTEWRKDFSVLVRCDAGHFTVPAEMFARADAESTLRALKTGLSI